MKRFSILILVSSLIFASDRLTNVGTTAASFLEVGVSARAIGMGGAYVAIADDISSLYWNPAGLGTLKKGEAVFEQVDWLAGISFNYIGIAVPLGSYGTVGMFINSMTMPTMKVRTVDYPDGTGENFDASGISAGLSYGKNLTDRFTIGFNVKYIRETLWHETSKSFAVDVGTKYETGIKGLSIGATITNYGPDMKLDGSDLIIYHDTDPLIDGNNDKIMGKLLTEKWPLPLNMQFGIGYDIYDTKYLRITTAIDAFHPINNTESVNLGCEIAVAKMLFVRAGYKALGQQDTEEGLTFGAGINYRLFGQSNIKLDYAYTDFGRLKNTNRFTLGLNF
jgi:opacity protein-like surface antigen